MIALAEPCMSFHVGKPAESVSEIPLEAIKHRVYRLGTYSLHSAKVADCS